MNCRRIQELIPLFVGDDLDPRRGRLVAVHLKSCDACRQLASEFKESQSWLKSYVPREFDAAYFERIEKEVWAGIEEAGKLPIWERIRGRLWSVQLPIAVGALLLVVTGIAFVLLRSSAKDGLPNGSGFAANSGGNEPDLRSARPPGTTVRVDHPHVAPVRKTSGKTAHIVHPAEAGLAPTISSPNPIASGFKEPGEVSSESDERDQLRIYIQTSDPNIRIIWIVPKTE